jgi:hypothetical protein
MFHYVWTVKMCKHIYWCWLHWFSHVFRKKNISSGPMSGTIGKSDAHTKIVWQTEEWVNQKTYLFVCVCVDGALFYDLLKILSIQSLQEILLRKIRHSQSEFWTWEFLCTLLTKHCRHWFFLSLCSMETSIYFDTQNYKTLLFLLYGCIFFGTCLLLGRQTVNEWILHSTHKTSKVTWLAQHILQPFNIASRRSYAM